MKNMNWKKAVSLLMAAVLVGSLTACSGGQGQQEASTEILHPTDRSPMLHSGVPRWHIPALPSEIHNPSPYHWQSHMQPVLKCKQDEGIPGGPEVPHFLLPALILLIPFPLPFGVPWKSTFKTCVILPVILATCVTLIYD